MRVGEFSCRAVLGWWDWGCCVRGVEEDVVGGLWRGVGERIHEGV